MRDERELFKPMTPDMPVPRITMTPPRLDGPDLPGYRNREEQLGLVVLRVIDRLKAAQEARDRGLEFVDNDSARLGDATHSCSEDLVGSDHSY